MKSDIQALKRVKRRLAALKAGSQRRLNARQGRKYVHYLDAYHRAMEMVEEEIRLRTRK